MGEGVMGEWEWEGRVGRSEEEGDVVSVYLVITSRRNLYY